MSPELLAAVQTIATYIAIPWFVWVTVTLFNQRQEIALIRQQNSQFGELIHLIKERLGTP